MRDQFINIHTHRPTGYGIELRIAGVHPWRAGNEVVADMTPELANAQAIGEIGLDYACEIDRNRQLALFREQLQLAENRKMPVVLHCVRAFEPMMAELAKHALRAVIFHGFIGSPEQAQKALARGYYLSFGERTFASQKSVKALCETPFAQLFFETDDSDICIEEVYTRAAALRGVSVEKLMQATIQNYETIFLKI